MRHYVENIYKQPPGVRVLWYKEEGITFSVQDSGIGISPQITPIIFDLFRQGDSSATRQYEGLGLYIVKQMVHALTGTVTVESHVGEGSTFRVWIPQQIESDTPVMRSDTGA